MNDSKETAVTREGMLTKEDFPFNIYLAAEDYDADSDGQFPGDWEKHSQVQILL
jgi:hypothetical protein